MIKCKDGVYYDDWSAADEIDLPVPPTDYHIIVKQLTEAQRERSRR